jgi:phosphoribosyl 1,2-cyclic phosphodiesterase
MPTNIEVLPLGSGRAFTPFPDNHSNYVLSIQDGRKTLKLLLDCGTTLRNALRNANISHKDINAVVFTHGDPDHAGGLVEFAQVCRWAHNHKPILYLKPNQMELVENLFSTINEPPADYFSMQLYRDEYIKVSGNIAIRHMGMPKGSHGKIYPNYAIAFEHMSRTGETISRILFSGDVKNTDQAGLSPMIRDSRTIAFFVDTFLQSPSNPVHQSLTETIRLYNGRKMAAKVYITHYGEPASITPEIQKSLDLAGFLAVQQRVPIVFGL